MGNWGCLLLNVGGKRLIVQNRIFGPSREKF
jgi:hypothetical protein